MNFSIITPSFRQSDWLKLCVASVADQSGVTLEHIPFPGAAQALTALAGAGLTHVLVEGGAEIAASLLRADLVDRIAWFHAAAVMGGDGWPAVQAFGVQLLDVMPRFTRIAETPLGDDMLTEFTRRV